MSEDQRQQRSWNGILFLKNHSAFNQNFFRISESFLNSIQKPQAGQSDCPTRMSITGSLSHDNDRLRKCRLCFHRLSPSCKQLCYLRKTTSEVWRTPSRWRHTVPMYYRGYRFFKSDRFWHSIRD